jgi:hypothetical protein
MELKEKILNASNSPKELELLYQENPASFSNVFQELYLQNQDLLIFQVWHERLFFLTLKKTEIHNSKSENTIHRNGILVTILLSLIAGTIVKLPDFFPTTFSNYFYINLPAIVVLSLVIYYLIQNVQSLKTIVIIILLAIGSTVYINLLPESGTSDTILLAYLHMAFFYWFILGISFSSGNWRNLEARVNYLRYNGELLVYIAMLFIGGAILTGITTLLFDLIDISHSFLYKVMYDYIYIYGLVALPIVATFLIDKMLEKRLSIASVLSKVFSPFFLIMIVTYLVVIAINQKNPFLDRDFLISFNLFLLLVLGLSIFSILERPNNPKITVTDFINIGLVFTTLLIDGIALSAILFRLNSYGLTPNRIAVLGANTLFFIHLFGILFYYVRFLTRRSAIGELENWISKYLPIYSVWVLFVAISFPIIFGFK